MDIFKGIKGNGRVTINGVTIKSSSSGSSIRVDGNDIYIDGKNVNLEQFGDAKIFNITVEGSVETVSNEAGAVTVNGNAGSVKTMSGDALITGDVAGNVNTMSGDAKVKGSIAGSVATMTGNIKR